MSKTKIDAKVPNVPVKALLEIADWLLDLAAAAAHESSGRQQLHATASQKTPAVPTEEEFPTVIRDGRDTDEMAQVRAGAAGTRPSTG